MSYTSDIESYLTEDNMDKSTCSSFRTLYKDLSALSRNLTRSHNTSKVILKNEVGLFLILPQIVYLILKAKCSPNQVMGNLNHSVTQILALQPYHIDRDEERHNDGQDQGPQCTQDLIRDPANPFHFTSLPSILEGFVHERILNRYIL
jgi:hypothetical protein